jgi:hypothetical protein
LLSFICFFAFFQKNKKFARINYTILSAALEKATENLFTVAKEKKELCIENTNNEK